MDDPVGYERKTWKISGVEFSYLEWNSAGPEAPLLHFAHANGLNALTYRRLLDPLAESLNILAMDARGHGLSGNDLKPSRLKNWDVYMRDLIAFVENLGKPIYLAGHSMGSVFSLALAARRPELVRGLLLIDPVIFPPAFLFLWGLAKTLGLSRMVPIAVRARKRRAVWDSREAILKAYHGRGAFSTWEKKWIEDYLEAGCRTRADGGVELSCTPEWEARNFSATPANTWSRMKFVKCPVTLVYGGRSDTFSDSSARHAARILPSARIVCLKDADHFVPMEEAEAVRKEILRTCNNR